MADKRIKIISCVDNDITLNFMALTNRCVPLTHRNFCYITEDELVYLTNTSKAFDKGIIKLDKPEEALDINVIIPDSPNALTDEDIVALLKKTQKQIATELEEVTNVRLVSKMLEKAKELDKSVKVCDIIQARLDVLMSEQM